MQKRFEKMTPFIGRLSPYYCFSTIVRAWPAGLPFELFRPEATLNKTKWQATIKRRRVRRVQKNPSRRAHLLPKSGSLKTPRPQEIPPRPTTSGVPVQEGNRSQASLNVSARG